VLYLFIQSLDYETSSSYSLTVNVTDGSTIVSQPLTISIKDANDLPLFTDSPYTVNVTENEVSGAVYTVSATDQDSGKSKKQKRQQQQQQQQPKRRSHLP